MENNEEHTPIFFEGVETFCPMCNESVKKVVESDSAPCGTECENEFYRHSGRKLIKFKNPHGAWESSKEYKDSING